MVWWRYRTDGEFSDLVEVVRAAGIGSIVIGLLMAIGSRTGAYERDAAMDRQDISQLGVEKRDKRLLEAMPVVLGFVLAGAFWYGVSVIAGWR